MVGRFRDIIIIGRFITMAGRFREITERVVILVVRVREIGES